MSFVSPTSGDGSRRLFAAAFDVELGQGVGQGGVDGGGFFVVHVLGQAGFGAPPGFLGFGFVNLIGRDGHVGQDGHMVGGDFDEAVAHGQVDVLAVLAHDEFAGDKLGHEGDMLGIDAHFAFDAGEGDHFDVAGKGDGVGGDDFQFEGSGHADQLSLISSMPPFM